MRAYSVIRRRLGMSWADDLVAVVDGREPDRLVGFHC